MDVPKFDEKEMTIVEVMPARGKRGAVNVYDYPMLARDAQLSLYHDKTAIWQIMGIEAHDFNPRIVPDNVARAFVSEATPFDRATQGGGKDAFGVEWVYVPVTGGSMEDPNEEPFFDDANDWKEYVHFPDIDSWDWEGSAAENNDTYLTPQTCNVAWIFSGFFERLISFMGFEDASVAMIDEDQEDAVMEFMDAMADYYIDLTSHYAKYFKYVDGYFVHDDWGSSMDTFVAPERIAKLVVPAMRRVTDHIHSLGQYAELHSCGCNYKQVPNMIAAGWDAWVPQWNVNDVDKIYQDYGDKIIIGVPVQKFDPAVTSDEEQRAIARDYAKRYCNPNKPSRFSGIDCAFAMTPPFWEELYKCSRILYTGGTID